MINYEGVTRVGLVQEQDGKGERKAEVKELRISQP